MMQLDTYTLQKRKKKRRVTVFLLEDYEIHKGEYYLKEVTSFYVSEGGEYLDGSGIEGLTVNTRTGEVYVANEKYPTILFHLSANYVILDRYFPTFSQDISDLFYDSELDLLWVLSDKSESLYVTSLNGTHIYDYWKLPMKNAEGLAIDNTASPKMMYIATDPSSPEGAQYVAALYTFYKPEIGTGRKTNNLAPNPPIICDGCDTIAMEAEANQEKFDHAYHVHIVTEVSSSILVFLAIIAAFVVVLSIIIVGVKNILKRRSKIVQELENDEEIKSPFSFTENDSEFAIDETILYNDNQDEDNEMTSNSPKSGFFARIVGKKQNNTVVEYLMQPMTTLRIP